MLSLACYLTTMNVISLIPRFIKSETSQFSAIMVVRMVWQFLPPFPDGRICPTSGTTAAQRCQFDIMYMPNLPVHWPSVFHKIWSGKHYGSSINLIHLHSEWYPNGDQFDWSWTPVAHILCSPDDWSTTSIIHQSAMMNNDILKSPQAFGHPFHLDDSNHQYVVCCSHTK